MQVTVKTLRHYEQKGLLHPSEVDEWTGYRYYNIAQMQRLNTIRGLQRQGFTLEEIKELLEACAEEGKFGSKAEAVARILEKPMDIIYASHMKVALFTLLLTFVIGYFVSVLLAVIFCMFSTLNARVCKYPLLKWAPLILELIFLLMIAG